MKFLALSGIALTFVSLFDQEEVNLLKKRRHIKSKVAKLRSISNYNINKEHKFFSDAEDKGANFYAWGRYGLENQSCMDDCKKKEGISCGENYYVCCKKGATCEDSWFGKDCSGGDDGS